MADSSSNAIRRVALIGNPNTGKSTLFNTLTGLRQKTANYPGVTVERHTGILKLASGDAELVDVPGAYSITAHSPDELVSADVLMGRVEGSGLPAAILIVIDAANLRRNLFMATQIMELGIPVVIALNKIRSVGSHHRTAKRDIRRSSSLADVAELGAVASRDRTIRPVPSSPLSKVSVRSDRTVSGSPLVTPCD